MFLFLVIVWHLIADSVSMHRRSCGSSGGSGAARRPAVYPISANRCPFWPAPGRLLPGARVPSVLVHDRRHLGLVGELLGEHLLLVRAQFCWVPK